MSSFVAVGLGALVIAATNLAIIPAHVAWLDDATRKQCANRAWPAANNSTMVAWCEHNDYPTSK